MAFLPKKLIVKILSTLAGLAIFGLVVKLAGFHNLMESVRNFSPRFLIPYVLVAIATTHWAAAYRWKFVLLSEGVNVPLITLFKYKALIFGLNYLTPVARLGGEPLKVVLLKRQHIPVPKSIASVIIDNFLGMGVDVLIAGIVLIALVFSAVNLSPDIKGIFLLMGMVFPLVVMLVFLYLKKKAGPFSTILNAIGRIGNIGKKKLFLAISSKAAMSEYYMRKLLVKRPKNMVFATIYAAMSWPMTVIQYKLALLMLGVDASISQILLSVIMMNVTLLIPIPGAIGVQEAGQFSTFRILSDNPNAGIALSFLLRLKDMVLLLISLILAFKEGTGIFDKKTDKK